MIYLFFMWIAILPVMSQSKEKSRELFNTGEIEWLYKRLVSLNYIFKEAPNMFQRYFDGLIEYTPS